MCICVYIYIYICVYMYMYICTCRYTYTYTHAHTIMPQAASPSAFAARRLVRAPAAPIERRGRRRPQRESPTSAAPEDVNTARGPRRPKSAALSSRTGARSRLQARATFWSAGPSAGPPIAGPPTGVAKARPDCALPAMLYTPAASRPVPFL